MHLMESCFPLSFIKEMINLLQDIQAEVRILPLSLSTMKLSCSHTNTLVESVQAAHVRSSCAHTSLIQYHFERLSVSIRDCFYDYKTEKLSGEM